MKTMISSLSPTSCAAQPRPAEPPQKSSLEAEPRIRTPTSTQDPPPGAPDRPVQRAPTGLAWLRTSPPPGSGGDRGGGDRRAAARRHLGGCDDVAEAAGAGWRAVLPCHAAALSGSGWLEAAAKPWRQLG